jgi:type II secretory pathway pseudopilin PulG
MMTAIKRQARQRLAAVRSSEAGITLVEILVSVAILGIAITGLVSAMGTASLASGYHRKQATADTVIKSYAEALKTHIQGPGYLDSAGTSTYSVPASAAWSVETGYSVSITDVKYWHSSAPAADPFTTVPTPAEGAQKITLRVVSTDGRDTETLEIIVRKS